MRDLPAIDATRPVLIAGATASGKSDLALRIAQEFGGVVVNADALQVYARWQVLTARPSQAEMAGIPHYMYGHVGDTQPYSVGHWLREVAGHLAGTRPIIVGGTGLYFRALTEGLAEIPPIPDNVRETANQRIATQGLAKMVAELDPQTAQSLDLNNPARVQRAWEVLTHTGKGIWHWQAETPPPLIPPQDAICLHLDLPPDTLNARIARRFDAMVDQGALDEVRANQDSWDWADPSARAIGAPELMDFVAGNITLEQAKSRAVIATRQYAKRQRTWFRARMADWVKVTGGNSV